MKTEFPTRVVGHLSWLLIELPLIFIMIVYAYLLVAGGNGQPLPVITRTEQLSDVDDSLAIRR